MLPGSLRKSIEISKLKSRLTECSAKLTVMGKQQETKAPELQKSTGDENPQQEV
jgi:hypothetical protein